MVSLKCWYNDHTRELFMWFAITIITAGVIVGFVVVLQNHQQLELVERNYQTASMERDKLYKDMRSDNYDTKKLVYSSYNNQTLILAMLNYEERMLIKDIMDKLGIDTYKNPDILNKRHTDYPYYYSNRTHLTVETTPDNLTTIEIPEEMANMMMQFTKKQQDIRLKPHP